MGKLGMTDSLCAVFIKYYSRLRYYTLFRKELGDALSEPDNIIHINNSGLSYGNDIDYGYGNPLPGYHFIVPSMSKSLVKVGSSFDDLFITNNSKPLEDLLDEYFVFTKSGLPDFGEIRSKKMTTQRDEKYYKTLSTWFERVALDEHGRFRIPSNLDIVSLFKAESKTVNRRFRVEYKPTFTHDPWAKAKLRPWLRHTMELLPQSYVSKVSVYVLSQER